MSKWSKEDKVVYDNSEVFQEFEKSILKAISNLNVLNNKIAQSKGFAKVKEDAEKAKPAIQSATQALTDFKKVYYSSADDGEAEDKDDQTEVDVEEDSGDDAMDDLVSELKSMAALAVEEGNIKLAYRIERSIDELLNWELKCE